MSFKESFLKTLAFEHASEAPICEFMSFWPETVEAYRDELCSQTPEQHFNLGTSESLPVNFGFNPAFEIIRIEDGGDWEIIRDNDGATKRLIKNSSAMPHYIDFPIKNRADFERIAEERHKPLSSGRYPENWNEISKAAAESDKLYSLGVNGPFAFMRDNISFEDLMMLFCDEPELISEITMHQADFVISLWDRALGDIIPGFVYLGEDMAYKTAPMISPAMILKFIAPAWDKIISFLKCRGVKNIILDSDGCIDTILPIAVECGFTAVLPMERAAGMDAEIIRKSYPNLGLIGGVDKLKIAEGRESIDREVEKASRIYKTGGYIPSFDHSVPPIVSYDNYAYYIDKLRNYLSR